MTEPELWRCGGSGERTARQASSPWRHDRQWEPADKPGSVQTSVCGNHSSGTAVAGGLERPTRKRRGPRHGFPIWSCSGWGLPSRSVLPPVRCALTAPFHPYRFPGGMLSVALSVGSRPPGVTWHPALRSPDFPPRPNTASDGGGAIAWPAPGYIVSRFVVHVGAASAAIGVWSL